MNTDRHDKQNLACIISISLFTVRIDALFAVFVYYQAVRTVVIPAKAGIRNSLKTLDSGLRRNDGQSW